MKRKNIAAIILEPIQGEGGVIVPPDDYLSQVADICKKHDILLILDEVQTGFGRTGTDWAFEYYGVKPDLLCSGKAAGCGITPVSFVAGRDDVMLSVKEGTEGATWSATPLQCLLVLSAIKTLSDNDLSAASRHKGMVLRGLLGELVGKHPGSITDIRGRGLFVGIDTVFNGKDVSSSCLKKEYGRKKPEKRERLYASLPHSSFLKKNWKLRFLRLTGSSKDSQKPRHNVAVFFCICKRRTNYSRTKDHTPPNSWPFISPTFSSPL